MAAKEINKCKQNPDNTNSGRGFLHDGSAALMTLKKKKKKRTRAEEDLQFDGASLCFSMQRWIRSRNVLLNEMECMLLESKGVTVKRSYRPHFFPSPIHRRAGNIQKNAFSCADDNKNKVQTHVWMNEIYDLKYTFSPHWQRTTFVIFSRRLAHDGDWGSVGGAWGGRRAHENVTAPSTLKPWLIKTRHDWGSNNGGKHFQPVSLN